jgi:class 3 adenylate cyclase
MDRRTLRFVDQDLEASYRLTVLEVRRRRQRMATVGGALIFAALAVIAPPLADLPAWPVTPILLTLAVANVGVAIAATYSRTLLQLDVLGVGVQLASGVLLLLLFVTIDAFMRFGAVALTAQSVFAFGVTRHPFRNAAAISLGHTVDYVAFGLWLGLAPGILVDAFVLAAAVGGATFGTYVAERGERRYFTQSLVVGDLHRRVTELFHRYIAPEVATVLIEDPARAELGGEVADVTVLFADLTGFTAFSERVSPEEAVAMLNRSYAAAVPVVLDAGGTIVQFAGDAVMAIFNAPVRQPDHALRGARAALGLQAAAAEMQLDPDTPRFRVGLNTGAALVGNVGSPELQNFTAIGDTTNLAARIQTFAPPGSVAIGQRTRDELGDLAVVRPLGEPQLKGKSSPVAVFELLALQPFAERPPNLNGTV